jgi:hypothetical protein
MAVYNKPHRRDFPGSAGDFWHPASFEKMARLQGVKPVDRIETVLGGWPVEEREDGFEAELAEWRCQGSGDRTGA